MNPFASRSSWISPVSCIEVSRIFRALSSSASFGGKTNYVQRRWVHEPRDQEAFLKVPAPSLAILAVADTGWTRQEHEQPMRILSFRWRNNAKTPGHAGRV